jgi:hypothetical protein
MEYFKSGLKSVLGTQQEGSQPTGAETVRNECNVLCVSGVVIESLCTLNVQSNRTNRNLDIKLSSVASIRVKTSSDEIVLWVVNLVIKW